MAKEADEVVSIRVPKGLPEQLRHFTGLPFSRVMRNMAIVLLNDCKRRAEEKSPTEESKP